MAAKSLAALKFGHNIATTVLVVFTNKIKFHIKIVIYTEKNIIIKKKYKKIKYKRNLSLSEAYLLLLQA